MSRRTAAVPALGLAFILGMMGSGTAQTVDTNFWVTNADVYAIATSDEAVYVEGNFTRVAPATGTGVPIGIGQSFAGRPHLRPGRVWRRGLRA